MSDAEGSLKPRGITIPATSIFDLPPTSGPRRKVARETEGGEGGGRRSGDSGCVKGAAGGSDKAMALVEVVSWWRDEPPSLPILRGGSRDGGWGSPPPKGEVEMVDGSDMVTTWVDG